MRGKAWILALLLVAVAARTWAATEIKFYYPVHLTGPLVKEIEAIVDDTDDNLRRAKALHKAPGSNDASVGA